MDSDALVEIAAKEGELRESSLDPVPLNELAPVYDVFRDLVECMSYVRATNNQTRARERIELEKLTAM